MLVKKILLVILISVSIISCDSGADSSKDSKDKGYIAVIDTTATLSQIAKANNIGEPYLRTKLGIRHNVGKSYTITKMAKMFKFSIDDLKKLIEDTKDKQAVAKAKKEKARLEKEKLEKAKKKS